MLERRSGRLAKARVIIGAAPGASQRDRHVRYIRSHHYYYYYEEMDGGQRPSEKHCSTIKEAMTYILGINMVILSLICAQSNMTYRSNMIKVTDKIYQV